ncbi:MAG: hypothetical protein ACFB20_04965 [Opitutales bacterium]
MSLKDLLKNKKGHVEVGDLLRLKRQERPDPAFWDRFERELAERSLRHAMGRGSRRDRLWTFVNAHWRLGIAATAAAASIALAFLGQLGSFSSTDAGSTNIASEDPRPAPAEGSAPAIPLEAPIAQILAVAEIDPAQAEFPVLAVSAPAPVEDRGFDLVAARTVLRVASAPDTQFVTGRIAATKPLSETSAHRARTAFY